MKRTWYKITFGLFKKIYLFLYIYLIFTGLLTGIVIASNHTKCVLLRNKKCMIQPTLINLRPNEYS